MLELCYECSAPAPAGETYCNKCRDKDDTAVQQGFPNFPSLPSPSLSLPLT